MTSFRRVVWLVLILAACSHSAGAKGADMLACAQVNLLFTGQATTATQGRAVVDYGKQASNPALRQAATDLERAANGADQAGVNAAVTRMVTACESMHIGPSGK